MLARPRPVSDDVTAAGTARAESDTYSPKLYDSEGDWEVVDAVESVAKQRGVSMAEVALAWLLGRPGVVAPIIGASKAGHLEAALGAVSIDLTAEERTRLEAAYRPHAVRGHTA
jgi:aryl-alcohol dehydrogenase-like predicted oxidoreductase